MDLSAVDPGKEWIVFILLDEIGDPPGGGFHFHGKGAPFRSNVKMFSGFPLDFRNRLKCRIGNPRQKLKTVDAARKRLPHVLLESLDAVSILTEKRKNVRISADVMIPVLGDVDEVAARASGYQITSHSLQFDGVCPACQEDLATTA